MVADAAPPPLRFDSSHFSAATTRRRVNSQLPTTAAAAVIGTHWGDCARRWLLRVDVLPSGGCPIFESIESGEIAAPAGTTKLIAGRNFPMEIAVSYAKLLYDVLCFPKRS